MIFLRRAYIPVSAVACGLLLLAGCSKDSGNETISNDTDRQQIAPSITLKSPEDPSAPSGSMSNVYLLQMNFGFARADNSFDNITRFTPSENVINAECTAYIDTPTNSEATLTFSPNQYYYPDERSSKLQGWYPQIGKYSANARNATVSFEFTGQEDIMISDLGQGNTSDKGLNRLYHFYHALTQFQFKVKASSEIAATQWGKITSIILENEPYTSFSYTLFNDVPNSGGKESNGIDFSANGYFDTPRKNLSVKLPASGIAVSATDYTEAGIIMTMPREGDYDFSTPSNRISIIITAENSEGEIRESSVTINNRTDLSGITTGNEFKAGYAYTLQLELQQDDVVFTLVPAEWKSVKQEVEVGENQPYVRGSDNYIISRNMFGDATGWTVRDGDWSAEENNVPAILEVGTEDMETSVTWDTANTACTDGWHLPTEQELKLIWTCQSQLKKTGHQELAGEYWSCTKSKETEGHFYYVDMDAKSYPNPATGAAETETKNVRCVRDIKMSID